VKVRRQLQRRVAASAACARMDAAWWRGFGLPPGEVATLPLRGRAVWSGSVRVRALRLDIAALRDEVEAHAQAAQDARTLHVGPTDTCDIGPFCMACGSCAACACEGAL
jgi:hypothetical protein